MYQLYPKQIDTENSNEINLLILNDCQRLLGYSNWLYLILTSSILDTGGLTSVFSVATNSLLE